ncbi:hypothetical protein IFM89_034449 [Coptis chinensis]|uniref:Calmodulin-binding domain-containing protein n=1 Tax=Coptis chinensis TaxID=261450 RepID=A0A835MBI6_9MAGN|nr:hypothetical protein IFM89_034449 [Coptis chinensis]
MAEKRIEMSLSPELIQHKDGSLRRSSTGIPSTSNSSEKILPHYLRASTGSCHDLCKYGRMHALEAKENHPILKGNKAIHGERSLPIKSRSARTRRKKPLIKSTPTLVLESRISDTAEINKQQTKIFKQKAPSPAKEIINVAKSRFSSQPKRVAAKSPSSSLNLPRDQIGRRSIDDAMNSKNGKISKIGQKKNMVLPKAALVPKPSLNRTTSLNAIKARVLQSGSPLKNVNKTQKDESKPPIEEKVFEKTLYVIDPKPFVIEPKPYVIETKPFVIEPKPYVIETKPFVIEPKPYVIEPKPYIIETKPDRKTLELDRPESVNLSRLSSPSSSSSSSSSSSPPSPSLKLHVGEEYAESDCGGTETEEYVETETDSEYSETENRNQTDTSKEDYQRRPRKAAMVHPEDDDPAHKLTFRRGKVVDLKSENSAPRRLRFRKGRVLGENENGKGDNKRKNFKKREVDNGGSTGDAESEKVVLRHQDVNGKKDAQGLFNNVIEETASKLAETRKSKVKALVGAFETVISLQERKPSATSSG